MELLEFAILPLLAFAFLLLVGLEVREPWGIG